MSTHGEDVKERILKIGLNLWPNISVREIGRQMDMSHSALTYHFGDAAGLKHAVAKYAVDTGNSKVIVQLLAVGHPAIVGMESELRQKHMATIR